EEMISPVNAVLDAIRHENFNILNVILRASHAKMVMFWKHAPMHEAPFRGVTPTDLKPKKKRIPPYSKPKTSNSVRDVPQKKQVTETQPAEEIVATVDATQSLGASESLMDEYDKKKSASNKESESPYDTESEIKFIKSFRVTTLYGSPFLDRDTTKNIADQLMEDTIDSDLHSMPDDETKKTVADNILDEMADLNASAEKPSNPLGHL
ncbi:hypothetical protein Tco_0943499, partial [Tanacetum coccineum]